MTDTKDIEDAEVEKIEKEETQEQPKVSWHIGGTSKIIFTMQGAPYTFEFPNNATLGDLAKCSVVLQDIIKDIIAKREEADKKAEEQKEVSQETKKSV